MLERETAGQFSLEIVLSGNFLFVGGDEFHKHYTEQKEIDVKANTWINFPFQHTHTHTHTYSNQVSTGLLILRSCWWKLKYPHEPEAIFPWSKQDSNLY